MPFILILLLLIAVSGGLLFFFFSHKQSPSEQPTDPLPSVQTDVTTTSASETLPSPDKTTYSDGTYTATSTYFTPKRVQHTIAVTTTLENDVITAVEVLYDGAEAATPSHTRFEGAYEPLVLGVALDDLDLARVGGASLTTTAFNEALATIASDASLQ